jgi:hypothetical protein
MVFIQRKVLDFMVFQWEWTRSTDRGETRRIWGSNYDAIKFTFTWWSLIFYCIIYSMDVLFLFTSLAVVNIIFEATLPRRSCRKERRGFPNIFQSDRGACFKWGNWFTYVSISIFGMSNYS